MEDLPSQRYLGPVPLMAELIFSPAAIKTEIVTLQKNLSIALLAFVWYESFKPSFSLASLSKVSEVENQQVQLLGG